MCFGFNAPLEVIKLHQREGKIDLGVIFVVSELGIFARAMPKYGAMELLNIGREFDTAFWMFAQPCGQIPAQVVHQDMNIANLLPASGLREFFDMAKMQISCFDP
ncbi:hypothetical protein D3C81_1385510 [compost metagenome]